MLRPWPTLITFTVLGPYLGYMTAVILFWSVTRFRTDQILNSAIGILSRHHNFLRKIYVVGVLPARLMALAIMLLMCLGGNGRKLLAAVAWILTTGLTWLVVALVWELFFPSFARTENSTYNQYYGQLTGLGAAIEWCMIFLVPFAICYWIVNAWCNLRPNINSR